MKNLFSLVCFYFFASLLPAQPTIEWQKTFGGSFYEQANSIKQTFDGGYIVSGITTSNDGDIFGYHGGYDFWVLKLSSTGLIQWKKVIGGSDNDWPYVILQTNDGGYIVGGQSGSNNYDVFGNHGGYKDGWVVKLSSTGAIQWQKPLGGSGWDEIWSAQQTFDNGYILTGRSDSSDGDATENQGGLDVWVVKLGETGTLEWQRSFGGSAYDMGQSVKQTLDGGYIIAAQTLSTDGDVTGNHGNIDYWVLKLSSIGVLEWQKTYGGEGADIPWEVIPTRDGGYAVVGLGGSGNTGDVTGHHGIFDYWIIKLGSFGELQWQKALGGSLSDRGRAIIQVSDGGYIVTGTTSSYDGDVQDNLGVEDIWIVKVSEAGELLWQKTYGGTEGDGSFCMAATNDGGFVVAGESWSIDGDVIGNQYHGETDYWIVKLSTISVATQEAPTAPIAIYPNPATQSISLQVPTTSSSLRVTLSDLLGRETLRQELPNGGQLDIAKLAKGVYFLSAVTEGGEVFWGKVEKE